MLDLKTRVHLEKIEVARRVCEQKLDCAGAGVVHRTPDLHRRFTHAPAQVRIVDRRGTFFDHFLMATLNRALTFAEMDHVAVRVAKDLYLDVPRTLDCFFQIERGVAKSSSSFGLGSFKCGAQIVAAR